MKSFISALIICLIGLSCLAQSKPSNEEYKVYHTILQNIHSEYLKRTKEKSLSFVILEDTVKLDFVPSGEKKTISEYMQTKFLTYRKDLLKDFNENNQTSMKLEKQLPAEYEYYFISQAELESLRTQGKQEYEEELKKCKCLFFGDASWQPIWRKYPHTYGFYKFSRIGFSSDKKYALVFAAKEAGDLGESYFYVLEKADETWKILDTIGVMIWVS